MVQPTPAVPPQSKRTKRSKRKVAEVDEAVEEESSDDADEEDKEDSGDEVCIGIDDCPVWNKYSRQVLYARWVFERNEKAGLEEEVAELKKDRKALEKEVVGLKKSLAVEVGERRKLVDLQVVHGGKLDELERADGEYIFEEGGEGVDEGFAGGGG